MNHDNCSFWNKEEEVCTKRFCRGRIERYIDGKLIKNYCNVFSVICLYKYDEMSKEEKINIEKLLGLEQLRKAFEPLIKEEKKFYKDAFSTPVKYLSGDLLDIAIFLGILIEKLDIDFFDKHEMLSFKDSSNGWIFKNIQINYIDDDESNKMVLEQLLLFIDSLDFTRVRLLENELTEDKNVIKEYEERERKKRR